MHTIVQAPDYIIALNKLYNIFAFFLPGLEFYALFLPPPEQNGISAAGQYCNIKTIKQIK